MIRLGVLIALVLGGILFGIRAFHAHTVKKQVDALVQIYARLDATALDEAIDRAARLGGENAVGPLVAMVFEREARLIDRQMAQMVLRRLRQQDRRARVATRADVVGATSVSLQVATEDSSLEELLGYLERPDPAWRVAGCEGLAALGEKAKGKADERLLELFASDPYHPVRAAAAQALGVLAAGKAAGPLVEASKQRSGIGRAAVEALAKVPGDAARRGLEEALELWPVVAADALGARGERAAGAALAQRLGKGGPNEQMATARALVDLGDERGLQALRAALGPGPSDLRVAALRRSYGLKDQQVVERQVAASTDLAVPIRTEAAAALGHSPAALAAKALRALMTDQERDVRRATLAAIAGRKEVEFLDFLARHVSDPDGGVARYAIEGSVALGNKEIVPALREILREGLAGDEVLKAAWVGLRELTGTAPLLDAAHRGLLDVARPVDLEQYR